ncbi:cyclase, partial [Saccharothrix sp. MB29]|nr:cyclase [Saccharothrix sp. MB29]
MQYDPQTLVEKAGSALGVVEHRVSGDLGRFKEFIEGRGAETGAWRGDVARPPQAGETRHDLPDGGRPGDPLR